MTTPQRFLPAGCFFAAATMFASTALAQNVSIRLGHVLSENHSWHEAARGFAA